MNNAKTLRDEFPPALAESITSFVDQRRNDPSPYRADDRSDLGACKDTRRSRVLKFFEELRRRKVCRVLTMYSVALWLISQVVDLAYEQLALPDWTLSLVLVTGLAGLPIALLLSWLLELTPEGLMRESEIRRPAGECTDPRSGKLDRRIDSGLLVVALAILAGMLASAQQSSADVATGYYERIAVAQFQAGAGDASLALSQGLTTELLHELTGHARFQVVASRELYEAQDCLTLAGSISTDQTHVRITATLIDNESMEVVWSDVIQGERTDAVNATTQIARDIVSAIDLPNDGL